MHVYSKVTPSVQWGLLPGKCVFKTTGQQPNPKGTMAGGALVPLALSVANVPQTVIVILWEEEALVLGQCHLALDRSLEGQRVSSTGQQ